MWYRITLHIGNKIRSGIREYHNVNVQGVQFMVLETIKKGMGLHRLRAVDVTPLPENHPEVQALKKAKQAQQSK